MNNIILIYLKKKQLKVLFIVQSVKSYDLYPVLRHLNTHIFDPTEKNYSLFTLVMYLLKKIQSHVISFLRYFCLAL